MLQQKQLKILLIGDSCTDEYVYGTCERLNPEAPVPILKFNKKITTKGMAWNVRKNLESFGLEVYIITNQEEIIKTRYIDEKYNQQMLRVDDEPLVKPMEYNLPDEEFDALVISDYNKGFLSEQKILELVECFDGPVFIDTKKNHLPKLNAFVKINEHEYKNFKSSTDNLIIGAGDTFLSALVYFYLLYGTIEYAIPYANKAATISVSHFGTYVLHEEDVNGLF